MWSAFYFQGHLILALCHVLAVEVIATASIFDLLKILHFFY